MLVVARLMLASFALALPQSPLVFQNDNNFEDVLLNDTVSSITSSQTPVVSNPYHLPAPPKNPNWRQIDPSSRIRLHFGASLDRQPFSIGATFRSPEAMGAFDGTCQYRRARFMDPGYNPYLIGAPSFLFLNSVACGQCLLITNPSTKRSVVGVIADTFPSTSKKHLDLHTALSAFLASGSSLNGKPYKGGPENYRNLVVTRVECDWNQPIHYFFTHTTDRFTWYIIIHFYHTPVQSLVVRNMGTGEERKGVHDSFGRWVVSFRGTGVAGRYRFRMGSFGKIVEDVIEWNGVANKTVRGGVNFPVTKKSSTIDGWPL